MKFGLMAFTIPVMIVMMILKSGKGPVGKLLDAGATSEAMARRPDKIGIAGPDKLHLPDAVKRGVLVPLDDGRYYVNVLAYKQRRRRFIGTLSAIGAAGLALGVWLILR